MRFNTNAYKLQPSLSERVIADGHGCIFTSENPKNTMHGHVKMYVMR